MRTVPKVSEATAAATPALLSERFRMCLSPLVIWVVDVLRWNSRVASQARKRFCTKNEMVTAMISARP